MPPFGRDASLHQPFGCELSGIGPLEHRDPVIRTEPRMELAVPYVDRKDVRRTVHEQTVGEAARRCPHIQRSAIRRLHVETTECGLELQAATTHEPGSRPPEQDGLPRSDEPCRIHCQATAHKDTSGVNGLTGLPASGDEPAPDEFEVQPAAGGRQSRRDEAVDFLAAFLAEAFLAGAFLAEALFVEVFLAAAFFAPAFLAPAFFPGAVFFAFFVVSPARPETLRVAFFVAERPTSAECRIVSLRWRARSSGSIPKADS